ncbi:MAG: Putative mycofactocin system creatinine amidohydrolase family protein MftE [Candidatus Moanabacter tarae]|uniref:Mycofactocin system creatinine amidohydrolase family protein MftE n=1 Tax=Candidatus Moanibacter tarae TaxID=2200854 RepID=A0A2Z4AEG7_9BACT|nr:MAG: Putative mycofactocin system creatinine amidohydrolase family protein MftE [Candidatus Moanabacter tarae]|tara:strand:+ start:506 stop:1267 length:762 start_codon:yes stop_codon:yes gene_type:complete
MLDSNNTSAEIEASSVDTAVLPVGAIEQHGPHLPISADWRQAEAIGYGVAERLDAFLLPALPFGNSESHSGFRGSITIRPKTLQALVTDTLLSLFDQEFRNVVVINTHGGNLVLKLAVRAVNMNRSSSRALLVFPPLLAAQRLSNIFPRFGDEMHAGDLETSLMLHLTPDEVRAGAINHVPDVSPEFFDYAPMKKYCPDGVWGRAAQATAEKGRQALQIMIDETVSHIEATCKRLEDLNKENQTADSPNAESH